MSDLAAALLFHIRALGLPEPVQEYRFHPSRLWRFDLCWIKQKLAAECDGGVYTGGRHTRGEGFARDCEKINEATLLGYRVLRFTGGQIDSGYAVECIRRALGKEEGQHGGD